jgi:uncharacterized protein (DUF427 family)
MTREHKIPGPDHPITIEPHSGRVTVRVGGTLVADTTSALSLREADYPAVLYIPRADVDAATLVPTPTKTYCPYKGDASYFGVQPADGGAVVQDAIWSYEQPYPEVGQIAGHVAFYPQFAVFGED